MKQEDSTLTREEWMALAEYIHACNAFRDQMGSAVELHADAFPSFKHMKFAGERIKAETWFKLGVFMAGGSR